METNDETILRSIYSDFVEYQDLDHKPARNPVNATIYAIDTNVLLNLYKYSRRNADDVIDALTKMSRVLFIPHQTLSEFWSRLEEVRKGAHHLEAAGKIETATVEAKRVTDIWLNRTGLSHSEDEVAKEVREQVEKILDASGILSEIISNTRRDSEEGSSRITRELEQIFRGHVGNAPSPSDMNCLLSEFKDRVAADIPPGNRDVEIKNGNTDLAAGDFLIWKECLSEAKRRRDATGETFDLTLITNDLKDDWVRNRGQSRPLAHRKLLREYAQHTGGVFRIATFVDLLDIASEHFGAQISQEARAQADEVDRQKDERWTAECAERYLQALWNLGYTAQLQVLIASYASEASWGKSMTVEEAKSVCARENMQGFSRPYKTALSDRRFIEAADGVQFEPMLSRTLELDSNEYVYVLQPGVSEALGDAIHGDEDFEIIMQKAIEKLNDLRKMESE